MKHQHSFSYKIQTALITLFFVFSSVMTVSPRELLAAPTVDAPITNPSSLLQGQATSVLATVKINRITGDPLVVSTGVYLDRLNPDTKKYLTRLGTMRDDGTGGDAVAGDSIYSLRFNITPSSATTVVLIQASVPFQGVVRRTLSPITTLTVSSTNRPPVITSTPELKTPNGIEYVYPITMQDPEGSAVTLQLVSGPTGAKLVGSSLTWLPSAAQIGDHLITIHAKDSQNATGVQTFTLKVFELNLSPLITSIPDTFAKATERYTYDCNAFDPEGKQVTFTFAAPPPSGVTLNQVTGLMEWTPGSSQLGSHEIKIEAADHLGSTDRQTFSLEVYDKNTALQIISPAGEHQVRIGETLTLPFQANMAKVVFGADPIPDNAVLNPQNFIFTPTTDQVGDFLISFRAKAAGQNVSNVVTIHVIKDGGSNQPPVFVALNAQTVAENAELAFVVNATDPEGDSLKFSAPGLSLANAFFNQVTQQFNFTPSFDQAGNYNVTFQVTDGVSNVQTVVPITVQNVVPAATNLALVVDKTPNPSFRTGLPISGNVTGQVGAPPIPEAPVLITGLNPAGGQVGKTLDVVLTAMNTILSEGTTTANFGEGISVKSLEVLTPLTAKAKIEIAKDAALGIRSVQLTHDGEIIPSIVAFDVLASVASIKGKVIDLFTQAPLSNAKVGVNGSLAFATTDAQGEFLILNAPSGDLTLIITRQNYSVGKISLSLGAGQELEITDPIALNALARPADLGGVLPPAATVASVLDRGVAKKGGGLTLDQAKAVVSDTMIAVGGIEAGVLDEAGNQLNPKLNGAGDFSLTQEGVENHAKALMRGDVVTLREFFEVLSQAFSFPVAPQIGDFIEGFQRSVDEAWANPSDPANAMPIILFNEGTSLSSQPPIVSADTRFNRFQIFLLMSSFLAFNFSNLDRSADALLEANGVDAASQIPPPKFPDVPGSANPPENFAISGSFLVPVAEANQIQTTRCADESFACYVAELQKKKTFSKVWRAIGANMIAESSKAALNAAVLTFAQQSAIGFMMGATGGRFGATIGLLNVLGAAVQGALSVLMFKLVMGWFIAVTVASLEPPPVSGHEASVDDKGNFVIPFDLSPEHVRTEGNPPVGQIKRHFRYHLYRVPNCNSPVDAAQAQHVSLSAEPVYTDNANKKQPFLGTHQFVVPRSMLKAGENHFRIRSIQYIQNRDKEIVEGITPLDTNQSGGIDANEYQKAGLGSEIDFNVSDINNDNVVDDNEYAQLTTSKVPAEHQIAPAVPGTALLRGFMGKLNFLPGSESQPGSYKAERLAREQELQSRANGRVDPFSKGFKARTNIVDFFSNSPFSRGNAEFLPEIEDFTNNTKAFVATDDAILSTNISGRQAMLDGDDAVAQKITNDVYQKHFNQSPNQEQTAKVKNMVAAQRLKTIAATQNQFAITAEDNVTKVIDDIQSGRLTRGKIILIIPTYPNADSLELGSITFSADLTPENASQILEDLGEGTFKPGSPKTEARVTSLRTAIRMRDANNVLLDTQEPVLRDALKVSGGFTDAEIDQKFGNFLPKQSATGIKGQAIARMTQAQETELRQLIQDMKKRRVGPLTIQEPDLDPRSVSFQKGVGAYSNFAGQIIGASSTFITFIQSAQVLVGDFSESCFSTPGPAVPVPTEQFPPTFEPYPGADEPSAIIRELRTGPKQGFFQREYPGEDAHIAAVDAGFPPGFLSTDRKGFLYAINMASTERFGGRIFRYKLKPSDAGADGVQGLSSEREFVGAVNYFSLELQVGRPAFPVAMTIGPEYSATGESGAQVSTQDLFIADLDIVDGNKRILKVPVSLLDTKPNSYPIEGIPVFGTNPDTGEQFIKFRTSVRHRIVGQPIIASDQFKLTGPSDLEAGPDPNSAVPVQNANSVIMFSDEEIIYAIKKNTQSGNYELKKIVDILGRRWSGLAFDRMGKFYFADYKNGEIFVMNWEALKEIIDLGSFVFTENLLKEKAFRIASGIDRPSDIELEGISTHPGGVLHVSTFGGIIPITLPIIGKLGNAQDVRVNLFGIEQAVSIDSDRGVFLATPSRENLESMQASIRARYRDANGRDQWKEHFVLMAEHGATILKEPLA